MISLRGDERTISGRRDGDAQYAGRRSGVGSTERDLFRGVVPAGGTRASQRTSRLAWRPGANNVPG